MASILNFFVDNKDTAISLFTKIAIAVVIWVIGKFIIRKIVEAVAHAMKAAKQDPTISAFLCNLLGMVMKIMLAITVIGFAGFDTGPFTALLAGATFAVAYAFQDSLGHVAAGISLLYQKQMRTGDLVKAADVTGICTKIEVFFSTITAPTGRVYICPNAGVAYAAIHNVSTNKYVRAEIEFEVDSSYNLGEVRKFLIATMEMNSHVEMEPEPDVVVQSIGEETLTLLARAWISHEHYLEYRHSFLSDVYIRFNRSPLSLLEEEEEEEPGSDAGVDGSVAADGGAGAEEKQAGDAPPASAHAAAQAAVQEVRKVTGTFIPD